MIYVRLSTCSSSSPLISVIGDSAGTAWAGVSQPSFTQHRLTRVTGSCVDAHYLYRLYSILPDGEIHLSSASRALSGWICSGFLVSGVHHDTCSSRHVQMRFGALSLLDDMSMTLLCYCTRPTIKVPRYQLDTPCSSPRCIPTTEYCSPDRS